MNPRSLTSATIKSLLAIGVSTIVIYSCAQKDDTIIGDVSNGEKIFQENCVACHQKDGKGKSGFAPSINNIDFLGIANDPLLKRFILEGRPGSAMAPYKNIPTVAEDIDDLVAYIRSWSSNYDLYKKIPLDEDWVSEGDPIKGHEMFTRYCSSCHGDDGQGYSARGSGTGIGNSSFLASAPDDYIKQTMLLGRAGTAMKPFDGASGLANLTNSEIDDIVSFLRTKGAYSKLSSVKSSKENDSILIFDNPYLILATGMFVFAIAVLIYIVFTLYRIVRLVYEKKANEVK